MQRHRSYPGTTSNQDGHQNSGSWCEKCANERESGDAVGRGILLRGRHPELPGTAPVSSVRFHERRHPEDAVGGYLHVLRDNHVDRGVRGRGVPRDGRVGGHHGVLHAPGRGQRRALAVLGVPAPCCREWGSG